MATPKPFFLKKRKSNFQIKSKYYHQMRTHAKNTDPQSFIFYFLFLLEIWSNIFFLRKQTSFITNQKGKAEISWLCCLKWCITSHIFNFIKLMKYAKWFDINLKLLNVFIVTYAWTYNNILITWMCSSRKFVDFLTILWE